jgi:hypothetical protein
LEGDVSIIGNKKMGFDVYKKICKLMMKEEAKEFIFADAFLTVEWNLMARSKNVVFMHILHIHWDADCLAILFCQKQRQPDGVEPRSRVACLC